MIIKDTLGRPLELTKDALIEITSMRGEKDVLWKLYFRDMVDGVCSPLYRVGSDDGDFWARGDMIRPNNFRRRRLGCREFTPRTFNKILRAAGLRPQTKKAKAGTK